ncbi:hypothetical protein M440DRAFT_1322605 [Trichoderma longibrachiatum ATCC 18648]|uniref:Carboxypeptidase Y homolog A n=1 Tax=Trichoderma longibrachiatum ATCC 18648 TaxID=983965 RepID=A0A2T4CJE1_TRILO|nr:hypothetical protein M440DRAFT_1322605 [Trichoderma longibrachiatum ATCC 18648]
MRLSTSALVLGAASSAMAFQDQKVLSDPSSKPAVKFGSDFESLASTLKESFGELTADAKAVWDEVSLLAPDAMAAFKEQVKGIKPKKHDRKPDGDWDHVVKGADVQKLWVEDESGEPRRLVGGKLAWLCVPAAIYCNNAFIGPYQQTGYNPYDIRSKCEDSGNLCYEGLGYISEYLNKPEVMEALGAEVSSYESCNFQINRDFLMRGDWMKPIYRLVPDLLKQIPVLIYAGDADFICNWLGNKAWVTQLEWEHGDDFRSADAKDLTVGDKTYGNVQSSHNLTWIQVYGAGHMTPTDEPEGSINFINRWIAGEWVAK